MRTGKPNRLAVGAAFGVAALAVVAAFTPPLNAAGAADQPAAATATEVAPVVPLDPAALTKQECSACHMAYPPAFLPQRSWSKLLTGLKDHFGEDASLPADQAAAIEGFLLERAGDAGGKPNRWVRRIPKDQSPLRVSETPAFVREHRGEVSAASLRKAGSIANCAVCHRGAEKGNFDDD